jgi:hypothetical protein
MGDFMGGMWCGVIENNNDPLKLYRYQVRIFGIHTENRNDSSQDSYIPTSDLPWALCVMNGSSMDGVGEFVSMDNGVMVIVSFLDPEKQNPIILGSLPRIIKEIPDFIDGFSDPDGIHPQNSYLNESSISRLARNEKIDQTIIQTKKDNIKTNVDCGGVVWSEPATQYDSEYPENRVIQTKHHVFEIDDTAGKERIHIYHKSGSSTEFHPNGDIVEIVKNKKFTIILSDDNVLIEGNQNIKINGSQNIKIDGSQNMIASSVINLNAPSIILNERVNIDAGGNTNITGNIGVSGNIDVTGNISASGTIIDESGNTNNHTH